MNALERIRAYEPPLAADMLDRHDFFALYPMDGGGHFITREIIGNDYGDSAFYRRVVGENALGEFGTLPEPDFRKFERWRSIEKSCWLSRCYFLPPLAKLAARRGDAATAGLVKDTMLHFLRSCRPPATPEAAGELWDRVLRRRDRDYNENTFARIQADETDVEYLFHDFQPASRIIHFLYAMRFLRDSGAIADAEWEELGNGIRGHARLIFWQERHVNRLAPGNHQALRGAALLHAADFWADAFEAEAWFREGKRILDYHLVHDFFPDGMLYERSPSYHCFELWHGRDAATLLSRRGMALDREAGERLRRGADAVRGFAQPDGRAVSVNDGYLLPVDGLLASLSDSAPAAAENTGYWPDAGFAAYRDGRQYLFFDASGFTGTYAHYHAGKNAPAWWLDGRPVLVDPACCNYDSPEFAACKEGASHSSLILNGQGDGVNAGVYNWTHYPECRLTPWQRRGAARELVSRLVSNAPEWKDAVWTRTVHLDGGEVLLRIEDDLQTARAAEAVFCFNFAPGLSLEITGGKTAVAFDDAGGVELCFASSRPFALEAARGVYYGEHPHQTNHRLLVRMALDGRAALTGEFRQTRL